MDDSTDPIVTEYLEAWEKHGATAKGVGWLDKTSQQVRFDVMYQMIKPELKEGGLADILDVGCGYGGFLQYLETNHERCGETYTYTGVDICQPMIKWAKDSAVTVPRCRFMYDNFLTAPALPNTYDMVVCSGAMNYQNHNLFQFVRKMWELSRGVVVFNILVLGERADVGIGARLARMVGADHYAAERGYIDLQGYTDVTVKLWKREKR